ncbi:hypothetical protein C8R47DRAFT_724977 [Mycena vitilis]|nr:hypothetical protein C8R47DRAFT_724977 [Mycena vitilis]
MDVTRALTPVKQYMPGFTRPSDLRSSNWFPGGAYVSSGKVYESPVGEAYEPHTVFLLESRYNIRYGSSRVEAPEYVYVRRVSRKGPPCGPEDLQFGSRAARCA